MVSKLIPALAALGAGLASAQSNNICASKTLTVDAAMATNIPCGTIQGSVKIAEDVTGAIQIVGPRTIKGDLIVTNATKLVGLTSSSLATIEGTFQMQGLTLINNVELKNLSLPLLKKTGGGLTIQNNTLLEKIDGLPKLAQIGGAVLLRGNFSEVSLPALDDVKGAFDTQSTGNIDTSCDVFNKLEGNKIQGEYTCRSNNTRANEDGSSSGGNAGGTKNGGSNGEGAAGILSVNTAILSIALVGGLAQLML